MILSQDLAAQDVKDFLCRLCDLFEGQTWAVFQPAFVQFASEEEHVRREIALKSGESAYRVTSAELRDLIAEERIGFDWTDLAVGTPDGLTACYLQCVDGIRWHVRTDRPAVVSVLADCGFSDSGKNSLPFPEQNCGA
jgi:hypothetical protein